MALTNKLTAIADAIRTKTNTTEAMTLDQMPTLINGITTGTGEGGYDIPDEAFLISGSCGYLDNEGRWDWFFENNMNRITTKGITSLVNSFKGSNLINISFDLNLDGGFNVECNNTFQGCEYLRKVPYIKGKINSLTNFFNGCYRLTEIPEDWVDYIDWTRIQSYSYSNISYLFNNCKSLRKIPQNLIDNLHVKAASNSNFVFYNGFSDCTVMDELNGLIIPTHKAQTSNMFTSTFSRCARLKKVTFATQEDGNPVIAELKSQTIDFSLVGHVYSTGIPEVITSFSDIHGITEATQVTDDVTYQALKNDPDYWTVYPAYSRYNHDSAVETINSLPDTSAYLATAGGTNTIKFKGTAGSATDGGAINTLTEEEIAVATAKGWTVTLV